MSRRSDYLDYIADGGLMSELQVPMTPEDNGLYKMAIGGFGLEKSKGFYRCKVHNNSTNGNVNYIGFFLDLGANAPNFVKVKATVTVRGGAAMPTGLGLRLFANNVPERENISNGYQMSKDDLQTTIAQDGVYTLEAGFDNSGKSGTNLELNRYLKAFISIGRAANTDKHFIDVNEITVEVGNIIYDITDSIFNFMEGIESDFKYMRSELPLGNIERRKMPFFGKKIACLGDSITFGYDPAAGDVNTSLTSPWRIQLREKCGFLNVKNYGSSGRMLTQDKSGGPISLFNLVDNASNLPVTGIDILTVMIGINDLATGVKVGQFTTPNAEGNTQYDKATFYGALQALYERLIARFGKDIPIVVINMLNANNGTTGASGTGAMRGAELLGVTIEEALKQYQEAIRTCAKYYNLPCLELQNVVGFDVFNPEDVTNYLPDNLHPNQAGHDLIAEKVAEFINKLA